MHCVALVWRAQSLTEARWPFKKVDGITPPCGSAVQQLPTMCRVKSRKGALGPALAVSDLIWSSHSGLGCSPRTPTLFRLQAFPPPVLSPWSADLPLKSPRFLSLKSQLNYHLSSSIISFSSLPWTSNLTPFFPQSVSHYPDLFSS